MINLSRVENPNETILEELYLANIPVVRVHRPYSFIGRIGNWVFEREWNYWTVNITNREQGLPLKLALELHNKKNPIKNDILGNVIRSGGDAGCSSPDKYGAQPIYNEELNIQLEAIGYKKIYNDVLKKDYIPISVGEVSRLCNEGKLTVERYVNCYHVDSQIGLNELVKVLNKVTIII